MLRVRIWDEEDLVLDEQYPYSTDMGFAAEVHGDVTNEIGKAGRSWVLQMDDAATGERLCRFSNDPSKLIQPIDIRELTEAGEG